MPTPQKEQIVQEMSDKFGKATGIFLVDFTGLNVVMTTELRQNLKQENIEYRVMKNTLAKLSFHNAGIESMDEYLKGVNGFAITYGDPTLPAKVLDRKKEFKEKLKFKAALFEGKVLSPEQVEAVAKLPSREELLGQLASMLQSPMVKLASTLNGAMTKMLMALKALEEKKNN
ncbi:MAG: 50S ribosomal protein L10 [Calditrichia bacterium]